MKRNYNGTIPISVRNSILACVDELTEELYAAGARNLRQAREAAINELEKLDPRVRRITYNGKDIQN